MKRVFTEAKLTDYDKSIGDFSQSKSINVDVTSIKNIEIAYDGGRLSVHIGDCEVFATSCAGNDFSLEIK